MERTSAIVGIGIGPVAAVGTRLRRTATLVALSFACLLALLLPSAAGAQLAPPAPDQIGTWGPIQNWPVQGKHLAVLPTGKLLVWSTGQNAHVWDLTTNTWKAVPATFGDLHCAGHVSLADGSALVVGGVDVSPFVGIKVNARFDPVTETWTSLKPMNYARWYPTITTLGDGRILATGGTDAQKVKVTIPEVYDPATDTWSALTGASRTQPLYPFMYQLPNGSVLDAAPKAANAYLDVNGSGSWRSGPTSGWDNQSGGCCSESGAMYEKGRIIRSGGGEPGHARTGVIDMNAATPTWRETESMAFARRRHNMVVLADGSVLAVGGTGAADDVTKAVLAAERWDPATEQWDTMAQMAVPRMYHSSAVLLPDGRVVSSGGDNPSSQAKLTAQIYSPPYLHKGTRPAITSAPQQAAYASRFTVGTDAADVESVALIRPGSATHAIDMNQRYMTLNFSQSGSQLTVDAPANGHIAPPGEYMLVVKNANGVPSVARWIGIGDSGSPPPPPAPTAPTADFTAAPTTGEAPLEVSFANTATGSGPLTFAWDLDGDGTVDSSDPAPRFTYATPGRYTVKLTVSNGVGSDQEVKVDYVDVQAPPPPAPPTAAFAASPTSGTEPLEVSFANQSTGSRPMTFQWDFENDGVVDSTAENPKITYAAAGAYTVRLVATNAYGSDTEVRSQLVTVAGRPTGGSLTFSADADAHVDEANPTTRHGTWSFLRADGGADPDVESYLRFNVSGVATAASAKLRLYATSPTVDGPALYGTTDASWSESAITWANRPARAAIAAADKGAIGDKVWVEYDVTRLVSGNGSYTFVLATGSTDGVNFASRQAADPALRPQLVVTPSAGATGPPTAQFEATPTAGPAPLTVTFTDLSIGDPFSWAWDFTNDDSFETTERHPRHTYVEPGDYTVRLQVENQFGGDEEIKTAHIHVDEPEVPGSTLSFRPVADAYVKSDGPTRNNGATTSMRVDASPVVNAYLRFDVAGTGGSPRSAKLRLSVVDASPAGGSIFRVADDWIESGIGGITWNNAPPITGDPLFRAGSAALGSWVEFDVSGAIAGDGTYSFAIRGDHSDSVYYASREHAKPPELIVSR